jgi:hypothetical protein
LLAVRGLLISNVIMRAPKPRSVRPGQIERRNPTRSGNGPRRRRAIARKPGQPARVRAKTVVGLAMEQVHIMFGLAMRRRPRGFLRILVETHSRLKGWPSTSGRLRPADVKCRTGHNGDQAIPIVDDKRLAAEGSLMKHNMLMFLIKHFFIFANQHKIIVLAFVSFVIAPYVLISVKASNTFDNANVIRDTQLLLSVTGLYNGPIDGQCNTQTKHAIIQYQNSFKRSYDSNDANCSKEILDTIKAELTDKLQKSATSSKDIDEI